MLPLFAGFCLLSLLAFTSCNSGNKTPGGAQATLKPLNVVLVTIDTLRSDHVHCYGYQGVKTPTLDALANRGVLFEQAVAQAPLTAPSHASIFTGEYPTRHHVRDTGGFILPSSSRTLATILQKHGWDSAAFIGSSVLKREFGFNLGFDHYDDKMPRPGHGDQYLEEPSRPAGIVIDHAIDWLNAQSGKPFFLWVHLYDPHMPYTPPPPFSEEYKTHPYDGEIAYADQQLGRLIDVLDKKAPGNTIIAVLSDHGESLGQHGEYTHGIFLYDSTLRIVFIMAGPGIPAGMRIKRQVREIDFLPTMLGLMGGKTLVPQQVQGTTLVPAFFGNPVDTGTSYEETLYPRINMGWSELRGVRTDHWMYIRAPKSELYDLSTDPGETTNEIQKDPLQAERLDAFLNGVISAEGGGTTEKVKLGLMKPQTEQELTSLGYLSGYSPRSFDLTGHGIDPKDRTNVLKLLFEAENPLSITSDARRLQLERQAQAEDPTNPQIYYLLGGRYDKAHQYKEEMSLYRTAVSKGIESGLLHSRIADLLVREGRSNEAIPEFEKAVQDNPSDTGSLANLATAYMEKGKLDEAELDFKRILVTNPDNATAQNGLGLISIQHRDFQGARKYFERAVQLDPNLMEAQVNLGLIYEKSGDLEGARKCFETFLAKASPSQYATVIPKVRQELAALRQKKP
ncbi:MAG TPA: tetratricopeptide repeat protein [Terriglobia bacterium]|nr:tetratricopeptide repeat protein [Terriglobia bacterium]